MRTQIVQTALARNLQTERAGNSSLDNSEGNQMKLTTLAAGVLAAAALSPAVSFADVAYNAGVVTDYRYRGISQSRLKPALQGGVDYSNGPFYLGTWASTIKWLKDAGAGASVEWDIYGGYKGEISKELSYDVGVLGYIYPSHGVTPSPNTTELYGALTFGPVTAKYSHSTTNLFGFSNSKGSGYFDLSATFEVGGFSITPHLGRQTVRRNSAASYTDYSVAISKDIGNGVSLSLTLVDTDTTAYVGPAGKDLGKAGLVLGAKLAF
jgi:uncharacterized protein (TIGR02001 family)